MPKQSADLFKKMYRKHPQKDKQNFFRLGLACLFMKLIIWHSEAVI